MQEITIAIKWRYKIKRENQEVRKLVDWSCHTMGYEGMVRLDFKRLFVTLSEGSRLGFYHTAYDIA